MTTVVRGAFRYGGDPWVRRGYWEFCCVRVPA